MPTKAYITAKELAISRSTLDLSQVKNINILVPEAKISIFLEKWASHIMNDFTQTQISQKRNSVNQSLLLVDFLVFYACGWQWVTRLGSRA